MKTIAFKDIRICDQCLEAILELMIPDTGKPWKWKERLQTGV